MRVKGLASATLFVTGCSTVLSFAGVLGWPFSLFSHFHMQYAVALLGLAVALAALKSWKLALAATGFLLANVVVLAPMFFGGYDGPTREPQLRVMAVNVNTANREFERVRELIESENPDVVFLQEVNADWLRALQSLSTTYPFFATRPRDDNFGVAFFSKHPATTRIVRLGRYGAPAIEAEIDWASAPIHFVGIHALPPSSGPGANERNAQLNEVAGIVTAAPGSWIVAGDFNATPWSFVFNKLQRSTRLKDSGQGHGWQPTWPARMPWMWIPIDHCLISPDLVTLDRRTGGFVGSDHYALVIDVARK